MICPQDDLEIEDSNSLEVLNDGTKIIFANKEAFNILLRIYEVTSRLK